jgi:hypothetical protein
LHANPLAYLLRRVEGTRPGYAQALETFFALNCAAVQAPNCPLGWMLMYDDAQLFSVVKKYPLACRY